MNVKMNNDTGKNEFGVVIISTYTDEITIAFEIPVKEDGTAKELTQCDVILLQDFLHCFRIQADLKDNELVFHLKNPVAFDNVLKNDIITFTDKYSNISPRLKMIPSQLEKIPEGVPIIIANLEVKHDQPLMMKMFNWLLSLQGMGMLGREFSDFLRKYKCSSVGYKQHTLIGHKTKAERVCRWCGRTLADGATFENKGHAISESIGNKNVILCDECDTCNAKFGSTIEEVAATYFSFENTLFGIHGKKGIPKVKSSEYESIENNGSACISIKASTFAQDGDMPPTQITIKAPKQIIDQDIYRCFCKYALSCCEDDIFVHFKHLVPWLMQKRDYDKTPWVLAYQHDNIDVETGQRIEQPIMNMYIRKDNDTTMPFLICELHHTMRSHVFIVPKDDDERIRFSSRENCTALWRRLPFIKKETWRDIYDLSGTVPHDYQIDINLRAGKRRKEKTPEGIMGGKNQTTNPGTATREKAL